MALFPRFKVPALNKPRGPPRIGKRHCRPLKAAPQHPFNIHRPSGWMVEVGDFMPDNVRELRPKTPDTEKITVNLGYVDLGHVDLMEQEGLYSNRTDFIRTPIRNQPERHAAGVTQSTRRKHL